MAQINFTKTTLLVTLLNLYLLTASTGAWDFICEKPNDRHTHELFCFRYYECNEDDVGKWNIYLKSCPEGRIFNETNGRCENGNCTDPCAEFSIFAETQKWDFQCSVMNERYQHESFCDKYYECGENDIGKWVITVDSCPPRRVFNETGGRCQAGECPTPPNPCEPTTETPTTEKTCALWI